jgi:hypothetical protein
VDNEVKRTVSLGDDRPVSGVTLLRYEIIVVLLIENEGKGEGLILSEIAVSRFPELSATQNVIKM